MIYMNCDYNEGAHEQVLARIVQTNAEQNMVLAATADTENLIGEFDLFNTDLFDEARQAPASLAEQQTCRERISALAQA